jgi:hypothetical protein
VEAAAGDLLSILGVVNDSRGVLQEILEAHPEDFPHRDRFEKTMGFMREQIARGVELAARLERFGRSPGDPERLVIQERVEQVCSLCLSLARKAEVGLDVAGLAASGEERSDPELSAAGDPVRFDMAVFLALEAMLTAMPAHSVLRVDWELLERDAVIRFEGVDHLPDFADRDPLPALEEAMAGLGGSAGLEGRPGREGHTGIVLRAPAVTGQ